jgi:hypothetical protein
VGGADVHARGLPQAADDLKSFAPRETPQAMGAEGTVPRRKLSRDCKRRWLNFYTFQLLGPNPFLHNRNPATDEGSERRRVCSRQLCSDEQ